ncbi:hypothetical protein ACH5RR_026224 [Cinchona calisaya]|uniref:Uncharacterized protein n=1 Tax=Cinchona calisaya TaxID=153742 RepID=A0ABD2Z1X8_9GENT
MDNLPIDQRVFNARLTSFGRSTKSFRLDQPRNRDATYISRNLTGKGKVIIVKASDEATKNIDISLHRTVTGCYKQAKFHSKAPASGRVVNEVDGCGMQISEFEEQVKELSILVKVLKIQNIALEEGLQDGDVSVEIIRVNSKRCIVGDDAIGDELEWLSKYCPKEPELGNVGSCMKIEESANICDVIGKGWTIDVARAVDGNVVPQTKRGARPKPTESGTGVQSQIIMRKFYQALKGHMVAVENGSTPHRLADKEQPAGNKDNCKLYILGSKITVENLYLKYMIGQNYGAHLEACVKVGNNKVKTCGFFHWLDELVSPEVKNFGKLAVKKIQFLKGRVDKMGDCIKNLSHVNDFLNAIVVDLEKSNGRMQKLLKALDRHVIQGYTTKTKLDDAEVVETDIDIERLMD